MVKLNKHVLQIKSLLEPLSNLEAEWSCCFCWSKDGARPQNNDQQ